MNDVKKYKFILYSYVDPCVDINPTMSVWVVVEAMSGYSSSSHDIVLAWWKQLRLMVLLKLKVLGGAWAGKEIYRNGILWRKDWVVLNSGFGNESQKSWTEEVDVMRENEWRWVKVNQSRARFTDILNRNYIVLWVRTNDWTVLANNLIPVNRVVKTFKVTFGCGKWLRFSVENNRASVVN